MNVCKKIILIHVTLIVTFGSIIHPAALTLTSTPTLTPIPTSTLALIPRSSATPIPRQTLTSLLGSILTPIQAQAFTRASEPVPEQAPELTLAQVGQSALIKTLSDDIFMHVFEYLNPKSLEAAVQVDTHFNRIIKGMLIYRLLKKNRGDLNDTLLYIAKSSYCNHRRSLVEYCLSHGAYVDRADCIQGNEKSALYLAVFHGHLNIIKELVKFGVSINQKFIIGGYKTSPLYIATTYHYSDVVKYLLQAGADVNFEEVYCDGRKREGPSLNYAVCSGYTDIVDLLLKAQADVNQVNDFGVTSICNAAGKGDLNLVKRLLAARADIHLSKQPPIYFASVFGHHEVVRYFQDYAAHSRLK